MNATAYEALTVARRILATHIPAHAFTALTVDRHAHVEIGLADGGVLEHTAVALHFDRHGQFTDRWAGIVDDISVTLRLDIPPGVIPAQHARAAA